MKKFLLLTIILSQLSLCAFSQNVKSCCAAPGQGPNEAFVALADDEAFRNKHEEPRVLNFQNRSGEMISIPAEGGETKGYLLRAEKESNTWLFVFHEWWGLNDYVKREAQKYYDDLEGVNVLCLDLYDGKVATTREGASELMQGANALRIGAIIEGAIEFVGEEATVGTVGWCFGGGWSLQASIMLGELASGCVMYYGMPETDIERLSSIQTDVLGIFASKDQWINKEVVTTFEENAKSAGVLLKVENFDADHAFANPSNSKFDEEAAREAYEYSSSFLKQYLQN